MLNTILSERTLQYPQSIVFLWEASLGLRPAELISRSSPLDLFLFTTRFPKTDTRSSSVLVDEFDRASLPSFFLARARAILQPQSQTSTIDEFYARLLKSAPNRAQR